MVLLRIKRKRDKVKGFTLLEIMIVIIIIGVLATLALPRLYSMVERARVSEAFMAMSVIRSSIERCWLMSDNDFTYCQNFDVLDIQDPSGNVGAHFDYSFAIVDGSGPMKFRIWADRTALDNGDTNSAIVFEFCQDENSSNPNDNRGLVYFGYEAFAGITNVNSC